MVMVHCTYFSILDKHFVASQGCNLSYSLLFFIVKATIPTDMCYNVRYQADYNKLKLPFISYSDQSLRDCGTLCNVNS